MTAVLATFGQFTADRPSSLNHFTAGYYRSGVPTSRRFSYAYNALFMIIEKRRSIYRHLHVATCRDYI